MDWQSRIVWLNNCVWNLPITATNLNDYTLTASYESSQLKTEVGTAVNFLDVSHGPQELLPACKNFRFKIPCKQLM